MSITHTSEVNDVKTTIVNAKDVEKSSGASREEWRSANDVWQKTSDGTALP